MHGHAMKHARAFRSRKMCVDMYEKQIGMCECKICMRATCGGASWLASGQAPVRQKRSMCMLRTCMSGMNLMRMIFKNTCDCVCLLYRTAHVAWARAWARLHKGGGHLQTCSVAFRELFHEDDGSCIPGPSERHGSYLSTTYN